MFEEIDEQFSKVVVGSVNKTGRIELTHLLIF